MPAQRSLALVELNGSGAVFDGFEVRHSSARGIDVTADNIIVRNSSVHDNWGPGINVRGNGPITGVLIENNLVHNNIPVSYTHLRAHETVLDLVCRLLLEKKKHQTTSNKQR